MAKTLPADMARHPIRNRVLVLLACMILLYVVVPQIGGLRDSLTLLSKVDWLPVAAAGVLIVGSYAVAGLTYYFLALRPLPYGRTVLIQASTAFANRILPAGLGGLTLNVQYLRKQRFPTAQAIVVASMNNLLGFVGHMLLLGCVLVVGGTTLAPDIAIPHLSGAVYGVVGLLLVVVGAALSVRRVRRKVTGSLRAVARQMGAYRRHPLRLVAALCSSLTITLIVISVFYLSAIALGAEVSFMQAFIVFTVGALVGTAVPTPGGLGGFEAGLVAGCVAYGVEPSLALAVALLFRLLTYWLPLLPGFALFMAARKYFSP
jgi:undecaprenyl-diphosphatase